MTVATYRRLWCDSVVDGERCAAWYGTAELPNDTATKLRRQARIYGWKRRDGRDLCPDCESIPNR